MKIGVNCQHLLKQPAGPEYHLTELIRALVKIDDTNTYVLFFNAEPNKELVKSLTNNQTNFKIKVIKSKYIWTQWALYNELKNNPVDLYFTSVHTAPFLLKDTKIICMIHGLEYKTNKQYGKNKILEILHPFILKRLCNMSYKIVVPSNATKSTVLNLLKRLDKSKIVVISEGVREDFYKRSMDEINFIRTKYGIDGEYIYFISTIQPRKNLPATIEAFANLIKKHKNFNKLIFVIAGKEGDQAVESLTAPKAFEIEHKVKFLGYVADKDRPMLLSGAKLYVNMSVEEGFNLTLLEALACEVIPVVSNIPAHKELARNHAIYANPRSTEEIESAIVTGLTETYQFDSTAAKALATTYSWENTARAFLRLFLS